VDQSAARLAQGEQAARGQPAPHNLLLLRANVVDIWGLLAARGMRLARHYLLYPQPLPKPAQVMRRWPAHPAFPLLLALGGALECRQQLGRLCRGVQRRHRPAARRGAGVRGLRAGRAAHAFRAQVPRLRHTLWRAALDLDAADPAGARDGPAAAVHQAGPPGKTAPP